MKLMPNHYHPLSKILIFLLSLLCIPVLFVLDTVFFQFTRPTCGGCANFGSFLANNSMTIAFIQNTRVYQNILAFNKNL